MWNEDKALAVMVVAFFLCASSCTAIEKYSEAKFKCTRVEVETTTGESK